jgi:putative PIN family toxin of toxin-antitoxin system
VKSFFFCLLSTIPQQVYYLLFRNKSINDDDRQKFIRIIKNNSQFIKVKSQINICRDFDDNKFLELVIDANAEYLLTGDQDLLTLKSLTKYQSLIVDLKEFLELN